MRKIVVFLMLVLCLFHCCPLTAGATGDGSISNGCSTLRARHALGEDQDYTGTAKAAVLYELDTKTLVFAHDPDKAINPTGLVKLMTALIVLEEGNLDDVVTVKQSTLNALSGGAKKLGLKANDQLSVRDLLYCVMVVSANDAAAVVADHVAGSQSAFVNKMNEKAATLGCTSTHFSDVNGLNDNDQSSTAREMAIIVEEALKNEQFVELFGAVNYQLPTTVSCENRMLTTTHSPMNPNSKQYDQRITGGKPSAASGSDRSVISVAQTEKGRYLCVLISVSDKKSDYSGTFKEAKTLFDMGLNGYAVQQVLGNGQPFGMYEVSNGENSVVVTPDREVYALLPVEFDHTLLKFQDVKNLQSLTAPVKKGAVVGTLQVSYGSIIVAEADLLACHDVAEKGTTIQPVAVTSGSGGLMRILKWICIVVVCLVAVAAVGILTLRQINKARYQKRKGRRRHPEQEGV